MKILIIAILSLLVFSGIFYLSQKYGTSTIESDHRQTKDGYLTYRVTHTKSTHTDSTLFALLCTGFLMMPLGMGIHYWFTDRKIEKELRRFP